MDNGSAASVILGLTLLAVSERDCELVEQAVETTATTAACISCGAAGSLHARRPAWVRDLTAGGRPVTLVWVKRVWHCRTPTCPAMGWSRRRRNLRGTHLRTQTRRTRAITTVRWRAQ